MLAEVQNRRVVAAGAEETLTGPRQTLRLGMWIVWAIFALYIAYEAALFAAALPAVFRSTHSWPVNAAYWPPPWFGGNSVAPAGPTVPTSHR